MKTIKDSLRYTKPWRAAIVALFALVGSFGLAYAYDEVWVKDGSGLKVGIEYDSSSGTWSKYSNTGAGGSWVLDRSGMDQFAYGALTSTLADDGYYDVE